MFKMIFEMSMLAFEAQQAIWLRTLKLSKGGKSARREAKLMVTEKAVAAQKAAVKTLSGSRPTDVVRGYRRKVRSNVRRLSKS